jgi:hypothetical protein
MASPVLQADSRPPLVYRNAPRMLPSSAREGREVVVGRVWEEEGDLGCMRESVDCSRRVGGER